MSAARDLDALRAEVALLRGGAARGGGRIAIATTHHVHADRRQKAGAPSLRTACGLTKWCRNAALLAASAPLRGRAEVLVLTNDGAFVRRECASLSPGRSPPRIVAFDDALVKLVAAWGRSPHVSLAGARHLHADRFTAWTLYKWQLVSLVEYQSIFFHDADVDLYHNAPPNYADAAARAWGQRYDAFVRSPALLAGTADGESVVNTGVLLLKPSAAAYDLGLRALSSMRFNATHGFDLAGRPRALLPAAALKDFPWTRLVVQDTWDVVTGNGDQGLFAYVFAMKLRAYVKASYCW